MNPWTYPHILAGVAGAIFTGVSLYAAIRAFRGIREGKAIERQMQDVTKEMDKIIASEGRLPAEVGRILSAKELLARVQALRKADAQWDAIWASLNPTDDEEVQRLLVEIRGPHMFAPHLGLNVIEDGGKRALASSPGADALDVLRQAIRSQQPFVQ